jgi:hypothetical protein
MEVAVQIPEIPIERERRLNALIDDERFHRLLDKMPPTSSRILRRIMVLGVITPSILADACFSVPHEEVERYQFLRKIQNAKDLDVIVDSVISEVESSLQTGQLL